MQEDRKSLYDQALDKIERGRSGLNIGLPFGFDRLVEYVPNIQQGTYYLIGAESGIGKTSLVDDMFMYNPYDWLHNNKENTDIRLKVFYYSLEVEKSIKLVKGICRKIWIDNKVLIDVAYVLSRGKNRVSDEIYTKVLQTRKYFEEFEDDIKIFDLGINPTGIYNDLKKYFETNGKSSIVNYEFNYVPNNPNQYTIIIIDHAALIKSERGFGLKERMDKLSEYLVELRNKYNCIPVVISQFNRSLASAERQMSLKKDPDFDKIKPSLMDFKDTGNLVIDCNVALSLFSPSRYEIPLYKEYDCDKLRDRGRFLNVLKSRDGTPDLSLALAYLGEVGLFRELPLVGTRELQDYYSYLNNIKKVK